MIFDKIISERFGVNYMSELDFDTEFTSDSEVEKMLDNIVTTLDNSTGTPDVNASVVNPYRIQHVLYTYKMLKYLAKQTKAKVSYELYTPYKNMGSVSVVGSNLMFKNTEWFMKAVELSSNFEVYPKTDGTVQMNFTFYGLTKPVG